MAGEFQNLGVAVKTVYPSKAIEAVINEEAPFRAKMSQEVPAGSRVSEGTVKFNAVLASEQNVAQIVDGDDLQDAAERAEVQFTLNPTMFTATMQIGWLARKAVNSNKSGFNGGEVRRRTNATVSNLGKFIEQTYVGTSGNGVRGYVDSSSGSGVVLKQPEGQKLLRQGHKITIRDGANFATVRATLDGVRIATLNPSTLLITTSGTPTYTNAVANDAIFVTSKATQTLTSLFANGVRGLVDDGTNSQYIHGQDRTTAANVKLKSQVVTSTATRNLTEAEMVRMCNTIREVSTKRVTDILMGPGQLEKWIAIVAPDRQRAVSGGTYDKGLGLKSENELALWAPGVAARCMLSFDVIPREMYYLNWESWFHYVAQEAQWVDEDSMFHMGIGTGNYKANWNAFMASFENIGCDMPAAQGVSRNLKDPILGD
jgi:hypothetical protein